MKNKKKLISCFLHVLCYLQHLRGKHFRGEGGGWGLWVWSKISFHVFFLFDAICNMFREKKCLGGGRG